MNDTCKDTALVRLSDAAGFKPKSRKRLEDDQLPVQLIDETSSVEDLLEILERGFFEARVDEDGDIRVRDNINLYIHPANQGVILTAIFDFREGVDDEARIAVARAANEGDWMVRFRVTGDAEYLRAEHYIVLKGGITARNFAFTLRRFISTVFHLMRGEHREVIA